MRTNQRVLSGGRQSGESALAAVAGILRTKEDMVSGECFPTVPKAPPAPGPKANTKELNQTSISSPGIPV